MAVREQPLGRKRPAALQVRVKLQRKTHLRLRNVRVSGAFRRTRLSVVTGTSFPPSRFLVWEMEAHMVRRPDDGVVGFLALIAGEVAVIAALAIFVSINAA
jgi:hypothetical protein